MYLYVGLSATSLEMFSMARGAKYTVLIVIGLIPSISGPPGLLQKQSAHSLPVSFSLVF